MVDKDI